MFALLVVTAAMVSVHWALHTVTVVGAGHDSVETMVDQDVSVTVTVSTVPFEGNAAAAVMTEATVKQRIARILFVEAFEVPNREERWDTRCSSFLRHWSPYLWS